VARKLYFVLEGSGEVRVGEDTALLDSGDTLAPSSEPAPAAMVTLTAGGYGRLSAATTVVVCQFEK
jgi:hypothetical protein